MFYNAPHKPQAKTASSLLDELAQSQPTSEAVIDVDKRWSYDELRRQSRSVAFGLWSLGVRPGDRVAILMGNRAEWLSSYFGILGMGATAVALNTWLTPYEQSYQLNHSRVTTLIMSARFRKRNLLVEFEEMRSIGLPRLMRLIVCGECSRLDYIPFDELSTRANTISESDKRNIWSIARPDDVACILYTSGSTAQPKGVPLQHWGLIENMWEIGERMHLTTEDRLWMGISLFWSFGCVNALFAVMTHGGTLVLQHHFEAGEALSLIEKERCSVFYGTPNMALELSRHPDRENRDLSALRTGAAIGTPEQMQMVVDLGAQEICNVYGLTEAYGNSAVTDSRAPVEYRLNASGEPLEGVEMKVLDLETGKPLPPGNLGEIALRGRLMPGYLDDPSTTKASMTMDGFLLTGDLGVLDEKGWIQFQGRKKELIKSGGINISPAEIETVLCQHNAVESAYVVGLPDTTLDQSVGAVLVPSDGNVVTETELKNFCRKYLAKYKIPHCYVFVSDDDLPLTSTGKLKRNRLIELFDSKFAG